MAAPSLPPPASNPNPTPGPPTPIPGRPLTNDERLAQISNLTKATGVNYQNLIESWADTTPRNVPAGFFYDRHSDVFRGPPDYDTVITKYGRETRGDGSQAEVLNTTGSNDYGYGFDGVRG